MTETETFTAAYLRVASELEEIAMALAERRVTASNARKRAVRRVAKWATQVGRQTPESNAAALDLIEETLSKAVIAIHAAGDGDLAAEMVGLATFLREASGTVEETAA